MFGGEAEAWANQTVMHPLGLIATLLGAALSVLLPRSLAVIPILGAMCVIPPAQRIVVLGLDFSVLRILVLALWARVLIRGELGAIRLNLLDGLVAAAAIVTIVTQTLLYGTVGAMVNRLGYAAETAGAYFAFRAIVRDWRDVQRCYEALALLAPLVVVFLSIERTSGRNLFSVLGGVPEFTRVREGRLRCQGAFAHPILAGVFWASLLPLLLAFAAAGVRRSLMIVGIVSVLGIVVLSASSAPVAAVGITVLACAWWPMRRYTTVLAWSLLGCVVVLHFLMEKGAAHLVARIDLAGGSTGWHRYHLIDRAVAHFGEWWLLGTRSTEHWGHGLIDVTNEYILHGVRGGVAGMSLALAIVASAMYLALRPAVRGMRNRQLELMYYGLGITMFVHALVFLTVSYFGQIVFLWQLQLACAAAAASSGVLVGGREVVWPAPIRRPARIVRSGPSPVGRRELPST